MTHKNNVGHLVNYKPRRGAARGKHVSGLNRGSIKKQSNGNVPLLSLFCRAWERWGGEIYGVSTGEWGAGGTTCHYRNGNGIYRSAAALWLLSFPRAFLTARLPPGPQYTPNYYVLKTIICTQNNAPVHYPHRSQWRSMLGKQSPFLIYLFNRVAVETIAVNSMTKSRPIQTNHPGICLTRTKVICISSMHIQIVFKVKRL